MIVISKIDIEYYRSLKKVTIRNLNHLNIFSGKNDIGKSNVLKALDTFFNMSQVSFSDDYNKDRLSEVRKDSIKGKQYIKITLEFKNSGNYKTLPDTFTITKTWDRDGNLINGYKDNLDTLIKQNKFAIDKLKIGRRTLTQFLNKIRYTYVPAIRDEYFFSFLLNKLQETIFEVEERKRSQTFQKKIKSFNETIRQLTTSLNSEFENVSGISSSLSFPNNISEIFQRLIIDTQSGEHSIPLRLRGDGIRLRYIPTILNYISINSKYIEIWGFDEPENSCEYSLSQKIAEQFATEYSTRSQIFAASHSFNFISLAGPRVSKFRVFRIESSVNTQITLIDDTNKNILSNELGILDINKELSKLYISLTEEMELISDIKTALAESKKPYLIFEGKTDNLLFEVAYKMLYNKSINEDFTLCEHLTNPNGCAMGSNAQKLNEFLFNHITKIPTNNIVIGIFDFDKTGVDEIKALKRTFHQRDSRSDSYFLFQHKTKINIYAITIVAPKHRLDFIHKLKPEYCYLSSELLLEDSVIPNDNKQYPTQFDRRVYRFTGDKIGFTKNVELNKNNIDFNGFRPTFDLISKLLNST